MSDDGMKRKSAVSAVRRPGARVVIGTDGDAFYLARIAELEQEIRDLKAELAKTRPSALAVIDARIPEPPIRVTADGTQGIRRGTSGA